MSKTTEYSDEAFQPIRLRRDPQAFLAWNGGKGVVTTLVLIFFVARFLTGTWSVFGVVVLVVTSLIPITWLTGRVVIDETHIAEGGRLFPRRIPLVEIIDVVEGKVGFGQGRVDGIQLIRRDGTGKDLSLSATLARPQKSRWMSLLHKAIEERGGGTWQSEKRRFPIGATTRATVVSVLLPGLYVDIHGTDIRGVVLANPKYEKARVAELREQYPIGSEVDAVVVEHAVEHYEFRFSLAKD